jgi:sugar phosphate isomerase/epimerase
MGEAARDSGPHEVGWVLWPGTIGLESPIAHRVEAAVAAGCTRVGVSPADVAESGVEPRDLKRSLHDAGLDVVLDPVMGWHGGPPMEGGGRYAAIGPDDALRMAEELGAVAISVIGPFLASEISPELSAHFARFCDSADGFGAQVHLEFMPMSAVADLATAWPIVRDAGRRNGGLLLDTWHFFRSGSDLALLEQVPGESIFAVQVADAPAAPTAPLGEETFHRLLPGDGGLDLTAVLRTLDRSGGLSWVGPEVISPDLEEMAPADAARLAVDRVRQVVEVARAQGR